MATRVLGLALALALIGWWTVPARAASEANCTASFFNAAATAIMLEPVTVTSVTANPTATFPFCDVIGFVTTSTSLSGGGTELNQVNFELALPDTWNTKFLFLGNGGFAGAIQTSPTVGLPLGFASAATDTGHQGSALDGSWALNDPGKQADFGFRGVHVSAVAAEALTTAYYGATVAHRYFDGCSDGGREAMVEAEVYPTDFDGIIAGDPALGDLIAGFDWNDKALFKTPDSWLPPDKLPLIDQAVLTECDALDGVADGLIQDPTKCTFNPASLQCPASESEENAFDDPICLTQQQIAALRKIYRGPTTDTGVHIYPGFTKSDPAGPDGWGLWITSFFTPQLPAPADGEPWGVPPGSFFSAPLQWTFQDQYMKFFVFNPTYDSLRFDINNPVELKKLQTSTHMGGGNGVNPDLSDFLKTNNGKLIMYHGWSDPALTPLETVKYYKAMVNKTFGDDIDLAKGSARLFMVPGMHHCAGGPGPNVFDPLTPLDTWVTTGTAPDAILAAHFTNNVPDRTMPLCPYPETAQLIGPNVDQASSWKCE